MGGFGSGDYDDLAPVLVGVVGLVPGEGRGEGLVQVYKKVIFFHNAGQ